ncbi:uncharacterized protein CLUP02_12208 [Colletotrichum lupini]|uniref:Uncharacterized protein n=1 Tax=Colletotrichum lupini TaxID=145971 RepID=A0A9Q8WKJ9_9PEZI|nr:uncharacterized protein CLUP02_12208 [Colletotrichum lupini]UQC86706.1 hypothetical protein CLUP02_12208 [Colletotrichum lupini]
MHIFQCSRRISVKKSPIEVAVADSGWITMEFSEFAQTVRGFAVIGRGGSSTDWLGRYVPHMALIKIGTLQGCAWRELDVYLRIFAVQIIKVRLLEQKLRQRHPAKLWWFNSSSTSHSAISDTLDPNLTITSSIVNGTWSLSPQTLETETFSDPRDGLIRVFACATAAYAMPPARLSVHSYMHTPGFTGNNIILPAEPLARTGMAGRTRDSIDQAMVAAPSAITVAFLAVPISQGPGFSSRSNVTQHRSGVLSLNFVESSSAPRSTETTPVPNGVRTAGTLATDMQLGCCRGPGDSQVPSPFLCGGKGIYCQSIQRNALCSGRRPICCFFFALGLWLLPVTAIHCTTYRCLRFIDFPMLLSLPADVEYFPAASLETTLDYTDCIVNRQFTKVAAITVYQKDVSSSETNLAFTRPFSHRIASPSSWPSNGGTADAMSLHKPTSQHHDLPPEPLHRALTLVPAHADVRAQSSNAVGRQPTITAQRGRLANSNVDFGRMKKTMSLSNRQRGQSTHALAVALTRNNTWHLWHWQTMLSTLAICTKRLGYRYAGGAATNPPEAELAIGCKISNRRRLGSRNGLLFNSEYIGDSLMASTIGIVFQPTANILHVSVAPAMTSQPSLTSDHRQRLFGHADSPPRPAASISSHPPVLRQPPANQVCAFLEASPETARKVGLDLQEAADTNFASSVFAASPQSMASSSVEWLGLLSCLSNVFLRLESQWIGF